MAFRPPGMAVAAERFMVYSEGPTRITHLPKFFPSNIPMKAAGACSNPSMISSR
jgi:hypothetical protein